MMATHEIRLFLISKRIIHNYYRQDNTVKSQKSEDEIGEPPWTKESEKDCIEWVRGGATF